MTTSGSTNYSQNRNSVVTDALYMINAVASEEIPTDADIALGVRQLNRMIKAWEAQDLHLWKKKTAWIFTQKSQREYQIYSSGDHAAETIYRTTLNADAVATNTSLTVSDSSDFTAADYIGIVLDDNTIHWDVIANIPSSTNIVITTGLAGAATSGNMIYGYTTKLGQPVIIYSANRVEMAEDEKDDRDVPLNELSYQTYFELPNKSQEGMPVSYNYDKQKDYAIVRLWSVPQNVDNLVRITYSSKIEDLDTAINDMDFPQEWLECITLNLAVKLSKFYGKNQGDSYVALKGEADDALQLMLDFDNESGSICLQPNFHGG